MAELSTIARPYAKAAFEYARENSSLTEWSEQLAIVAAVVGNKSMEPVLGNPGLTAAQQAQTLNDVCGDAIGPQVRNFLVILASNKRLSLLPEIHTQFEQHKANQEKSVDVEVISAFEVPEETVMGTIYVNRLYEMADFERKYTELPKYPAVTRDIAILVDDDVTSGSIIKLINESAGAYLEKVNFFDVYKGAQTGEGKKSLAFSMVYRSSEKTSVSTRKNSAN